MVLVLGLGNPGARYAGTRHNAGWWVVETLVERWKARPEDEAGEYRRWRSEFAGHTVELVAPLTFMNRSGEALAAWSARRELDPGSMLVVADDVYLPLGMVHEVAKVLRAHGLDPDLLALSSALYGVITATSVAQGGTAT